MYLDDLRTHADRGLRPRGSVARLFVTAAVLSACGDSVSPVDPSASFSLFEDGASASRFAALANAAVTCTNGTITGDVGTFLAPPNGSVTLTDCEVDGSIHIGDGLAEQAYEDFLAEYDALAEVECDEILTGTLDGVTLSPGVYCFEAAAALTGTLTLDGGSNDTWLFKIGASGTGALTGTGFSVVMNGGDPCNVTWWVAEAATLTDSNFQGSVLAGAAITLTRGTFDGNAWSKADVTITGTAVSGCEGNHGSPGSKGDRCNQGVGNGPEGCDPGNSNNRRPSNDENGGLPGNPGRR